MLNINIKQSINNKYEILIRFLFIVVAILGYILIEMSMFSLKEIMSRNIMISLLNIVCIFTATFILYVVINKRSISILIIGSISYLFAIINFYVLHYHNMPFTISEIYNISTALNVIGRYDLIVTKKVVFITLLFCMVVFCSFIIASIERRYKLNKITRYEKLLVTIVLVVFLFFGFAGKNPIKPATTIGFRFDYAASKYGYLLTFFENAISFSNKYNIPEGYSESEMINVTKKITFEKPNTNNNPPDIILILNETFYDPTILLDLKTDVNYLQSFYEIDNSIKGYMVTPSSATNDAEYELLTSNSTQLINGTSPFTFMNLNNSNSIVNYLKSLGYETWAMHFLSGTNYARSRAYPALGFDHVIFFDDIKPKYKYSHYGNRYHTDKEDYEHMISMYNSGDNKPRFMYLLTYQNHGGWELNESSLDNVHVLNDYGEYADDLNEFLTSVNQSETAFCELLEYFRHVDRDVIIAMVGDHAPAFLDEIKPSKEHGEDTARVRMASTPFIIWANYDIDSANLGYISLIDMFPMIVQQAKLPLSPYLQSILSRQNNVPVMTAFGILIDNHGNIYQSKESPYKEIIKKYLYMEYANLINDNKYEYLFEPEKN